MRVNLWLVVGGSRSGFGVWGLNFIPPGNGVATVAG